MMNLSELKLGEKALIKSFTDDRLALKFIEMGCLPGEWVLLSNIAPLGDPIAVEVSGYKLSMRKAEASTILVDMG